MYMCVHAAAIVINEELNRSGEEQERIVVERRLTMFKTLKLGFHLRGKRKRLAAAACGCGMRYANDLIPYTFTHTFALSFPERRRAKKKDNQSKMQLCLLDMEKLELLLIAVAHTFMQLKTHNQRRKHRWWVPDIIKNRFQQGAYHNLVKDLQFDEEKFQQ